MLISNKPRCFITSMGTSLAENFGGLSIDEIVSPKTEVNENDFIRKCNNSSFFETSFLSKAANHIGSNQKLSAEIKAIETYNLKANDKIILVSSRTTAAFFCAKALQCYFSDVCSTKISIADSDIKIVMDLRAPDDENFQTRGLPDFLNVIVNLIKKYQSDYEIVLNPTGGYKSLFPFMMITGIIYGANVIYIYEKSDRLVKIPPMPLHVSIPGWTLLESLVEVLSDKKDHEGNMIFEENKESLWPLLFEKIDDASGNIFLKRSALVTAFDEHAKLERGKPELIVRTENSHLVIQVLNDRQREIFRRLTEIGHLIWKGDQVPEMADHALLHHSDLFHLAERILLPIFYYNENFLEPNELFILLCALYLHDCGHVIGSIKLEDSKSFPLLPVEIREHHHVLGYLRLKYPEVESYLGYLIYDQLCDINKSCSDNTRKCKWKEAWNDYLHAVACLGLYHRKKMNIKLKKVYNFYKEYPLKKEDKEHPSLYDRLKNKPVKVFGKEIKYPRMALLVSLLRIIDSLDEQASRTGSINDIKFHLAQLNTDAKNEKQRADALSNAVSEGAKKEIDAALKNLSLDFEIKEEKGKDFTPEEKKQAIDTNRFRKTYEEIIKNNNENQYLLFEYADASVRSFFKKFQIKPYGEKAYINGISVGHQNNGSVTTILIDLKMEDDPNKISVLQSMFQIIDVDGEQLNMTDEKGRNKHKKDMLNAIEKEYINKEKNEDKTEEEAVVKNTLEFFNVKIEYGEP
ncbi:MAG: putative CRISPR-associated protein [Desulfobacterales bacterium]